MKLNPWLLLALAPLGAFAFQSGFVAQLLVLGVTLGIFFGTLSLGRRAAGDATSTGH